MAVSQVGLQRAGQRQTLCPDRQFPGSDTGPLRHLLPACGVLAVAGEALPKNMAVGAKSHGKKSQAYNGMDHYGQFAESS